MNGECNDEEYKEFFSCRMESAKMLSDILTCLSGSDRRDCICQVEAGCDALIFEVCGKGKSCQARAILKLELFEEYVFENSSDDPIRFSLNLPILLDCLQLFGPTADAITATLTYSNQDGYFKVSLEESGVLTACDIMTLVPESDGGSGEEVLSMFSVFREYSESCRLILHSEPLREAMAELFDVVGGGDVVLSVSPTNDTDRTRRHQDDEARFNLTVQGSSDTLEIELPKSVDAFVMFECSQSTKFSYANPSLQLCLKALAISKETYLRINCEGMLSVQHQIRDIGRGHDTYIDYLLLAVENSQL